eukprot:359978-Chlamydomonas_euryale.AAC.5
MTNKHRSRGGGMPRLCFLAPQSEGRGRRARRRRAVNLHQGVPRRSGGQYGGRHAASLKPCSGQPAVASLKPC